MIELKHRQGSQEWLDARVGVCTASEFRVARERTGLLTPQQMAYFTAIAEGCSEKMAIELAGYKAKPKSETLDRAIANGMAPVGEHSAAAHAYALRLAYERDTGLPFNEQRKEFFAMQRGHELEPAARSEHEMQRGVTVREVGLILTDDEKFGASVDGLIGADGGSEYKAPLSEERIINVVLGGDISEYVDQCQGGMWITGRAWWHLCIYCPQLAYCGRELTVFEIKRDDDFIDRMELDLVAFDRLVESYRGKLMQVAA